MNLLGLSSWANWQQIRGMRCIPDVQAVKKSPCRLLSCALKGASKGLVGVASESSPSKGSGKASKRPSVF